MSDERPDAEARCEAPESAVGLGGLAQLGPGVPERRRRMSVYEHPHVADLLQAASRSGIEVHAEQCCESRPAPAAVVTCARRVLTVAFAAFSPPVSKRVDLHLCHIAGQIGLQVTARDRRSFSRLQAMDGAEAAWAELLMLFVAFSPVFCLEPLRGDRASIAAILPFDPAASWGLPKCSHLRFGKG
jgi:hypothetical protein